MARPILRTRRIVQRCLRGAFFGLILAATLTAAAGKLEQGVPFYFAVPESAWLDLDATATKDLKIVRAPVKGFPDRPAGLRIIRAGAAADRAALSRRLVASGVLRTGDVILMFRPVWEATTPYAHLMMGNSHTGFVVVEDGLAFNVENPLDEPHVGAEIRSPFDSKEYLEAEAFHILRPRGFSKERQAHLVEWVRRLRDRLPEIRAKGLLPFNTVYLNPRYATDRELGFVKQTAAILRNKAQPGAPVRMFCSEFVWVFLSLSACDPSGPADRDSECTEKIFEPMRLLSASPLAPPAERAAGYIEGPLMVMESLGIPPQQRAESLSELFSEGENKGMSLGHQLTANQTKPLVGQIKAYYLARLSGKPAPMFKDIRAPDPSGPSEDAAKRSRAFEMPSYPPISFLVNAMLPPESKYRKFDYVGTVSFEE